MKYRLIALDLDGTLLDEDHILSKETIEYIKKINSQELQVIIATGRMFVSALPYAKKLNLSGPVISYNGAYVKDLETREVLFHKPIDLDIARKVIEDAEEEGLHINLYQDDKLYIEKPTTHARNYEEVAGIKANYVGPLSGFIEKDPTKLLVITDNRQEQNYYLEYFQEKYGSEIEVAESVWNFIEFGAAGVTKGRALKEVAGRMGIKREEVIAIGDGWNDYEMLKWSGRGIIMANGADELKEEFNLVAPPHREDGAIKALSQVLNISPWKQSENYGNR